MASLLPSPRAVESLARRVVPPLERAADAGANAWDLLAGEGVADLTPLPKSILDEGPQRTVYRFMHGGARPERHAPVLLVPPLAAPATCFDLRRGCSMAEHLLESGFPTYLVDYGPISYSDRALGLEHWIDDVIPSAIRDVSEDAGGEGVQLVGWCLGGIMSALSVAGHQELPVRSVSLVASPFDFEQMRLMAPIRQLGKLTGGALVTGLYRAMGGAPAPLVSLGFRLTGFDKMITMPYVLARHIDDRDFLAQVEAVDNYMSNMLAYPGRTFGQLYHRFFRVNELAKGRLTMEDDRVIELGDVKQPCLVVAGSNDVLAPKPAVYAVGPLLEGAAEVTLETSPGGHLGVLTGRAARNTTWLHLDEFLAEHDVEPAGLPAAA